ncbi:hypothetical protein [Halobaculum lipolyticum]|uniref:Uncharacterized protein n=1 Tax=Halobaculum lipolyticum TaxID=3032001 RepID=A0ABD5W985_9EURY|nr:hypothetical protein [Halobaculum sp. DT31]
MSETLSNLGTRQVEATEETNDAGQISSILTLSPIDGMELEVSNMGGAGFPVQFKLFDSNGDPLPLDTEVYVRWDAPHLDQPEVVSFKLSNIGTFNRLSIKEQQNTEYRDRTRIELKGRSLVVEDIEEMEIAINSSAVVDWSQGTEFYFDDKAVTVRSEEA